MMSFLYNKNAQNQKKPKTPTIWDASPLRLEG
jgi:hypothetical protein